MWIFFTAILTASLLGSMHCVGMCGPLAIWATGVGEPISKRSMALNGSLYHVGRLMTYLLAGFIAGAIGSVVDLGGEFVGFQVAAARFAGGIMIAVGASRLWVLVKPNRATPPLPLKPSRIGGLLIRLRPYLFRLPPTARALGTGLLTTLLPCGWLYLFALIAAGTGSVLMGPVVMLAFWIGTVPALTSLVAGTRMLSQNSTMIVPIAAASLLIVAGLFTSSGRGFANFGDFSEWQPTSMHAGDYSEMVLAVQQAESKPLPCCQMCSQPPDMEIKD